MLIRTILFLLLFLIYGSGGQFQMPSRISVTPNCGSTVIQIVVKFNPEYYPNGKFTDWIVVGVSGRPECRQKGNGELTYMIDIAVYNDPCMTQMPSPGVFQNRIRIGHNPNVILQGDQTLTVKCIYGLPEVNTVPLPTVTPNFNIDNSAHNNAIIPAKINNGQPNGFLVQPQPNVAIEPPEQPINGGRISGSEGQSQANIGVTGLNSGNRYNGVDANKLVPITPTSPNIGGSIDDSNKQTSSGSNNVAITGTSSNGFPSEHANANDLDQLKKEMELQKLNEQLNKGESSGQNAVLTGNVSKSNNQSVAFWVILGLLLFVLLIALLLLCLYCCLRRRRQREENRRTLLAGAPPSSRDKSQSGLGHLWWTSRNANSLSQQQQGYTIAGQGSDGSAASPSESQASTAAATTATIVAPKSRGIFKKNSSKTERDAPRTQNNFYNDQSSDSHYASAGFYGRNKFEQNDGGISTRQSSSNRGDYLETLDRRDATLAANNLRSNLEEFMSKTSTFDKPLGSHYRSRLDFHETKEVYNERAIDAEGTGSTKDFGSLPKSYAEWRRTMIAGDAPPTAMAVSSTSQNQNQSQNQPPDDGVSSYRSVTEIYHSAETKRNEPVNEIEHESIDEEIIVETREIPIEEQLARAVLPIRGFGPRRLTEQEMGRWRGLISRDIVFRDELVSAKSLRQLEELRKRPEYRHIFTEEKWRQIMQCVYDAMNPTSNLHATNSQSQLNVYVGNVATDW